LVLQVKILYFEGGLELEQFSLVFFHESNLMSAALLYYRMEKIKHEKKQRKENKKGST